MDHKSSKLKLHYYSAVIVIYIWVAGPKAPRSSVVRVMSSRPLSGTDANARIRGLIAEEKNKQHQVKLKINKYYKSLEEATTVT